MSAAQQRKFSVGTGWLRPLGLGLFTSCLLFAAPAQGSLLIDFALDEGFSSSYRLTDVGGSGIDVVAFGFQGFAPAQVDLDPVGDASGAGIGVVGLTGGGDDDLEPPLGIFSSETLVFGFFETGTNQVARVLVEAIGFSNVDGNDNFDLFIDGGLVGDEIPLFAPQGANPYVPPSPIETSVVGIRADGFGALGQVDNFKVRSIRIARPIGPDGGVPEPFGFALLGVGGLSFLMLRRSRELA